MNLRVNYDIILTYMWKTVKLNKKKKKCIVFVNNAQNSTI